MCSGKKNKAIGVDFYNLDITGKVAKTHTAGRNDKSNIPRVVTFEPGIAFSLRERDYKDPQAVVLENHPNDSRVKIDDSGTVQTLTSRCGTGGGNVPMVLEPVCFQQNQREEAAKVCQSIKFILDNEDYSEEVEEALDMAIEALEQEPKCEDCKWNTWDNNCMVEYRGCRFEPKRESDEE